MSKILVISHNAFSSTNNMGKTLAALFNEFESSEIAQLYFHSYNPDIDCCSSWYQMTDFDVLKSIVKKDNCGRVVSIKDSKIFNDDSVEAKVYRVGKDHSPFKLLVRDLIWKMGHWKTKDLLNWVENFNPTCIFFASGYSVFAYNIALYLSKKYNIPLITYFCDDYYNENTRFVSPFSWINKYIFRRKVDEIVEKSNELVFISESMKKEYEGIFGKKGHTIMTPSSIQHFNVKSSNKQIVISYMGNVLLGRWKVLVKIAEAVSNINRNGTKINFEIYSGNVTDEIVNELNVNGYPYFKGKLSAEAVIEKMEKSDVLLHVESFEGHYIEKTKHSVSTKIADCLASNRVLLAVGPQGIASVDYLLENKASYIISDDSKIEEKLREYFINNDIDINLMNNAKELAEKNHNIVKNSNRLKSILKK